MYPQLDTFSKVLNKRSYKLVLETTLVRDCNLEIFYIGTILLSNFLSRLW